MPILYHWLIVSQYGDILIYCCISRSTIINQNIMTSEPVTAITVMKRTSGLSIRKVWNSISSYAFNINKRAKVTLTFIWNSDLSMLTQSHNIMTGLGIYLVRTSINVYLTTPSLLHIATCIIWHAIHLSHPSSGLTNHKILKQHFCVLMLYKQWQ